MGLSRRTLLKTGGGAGALLVARPLEALARPVGPEGAFDTSRRSRLFPRTRLVHADLHNHTLLSDGAGDVDEAFGSMRDAGLDVAALTDHATFSYPGMGLADPCGAVREVFGPPEPGERDPCQSLAGLDEPGWQRTGALADEANDDRRFTAIRGFEWSSPTLGHMNVWFSQTWIDPLSTGGAGTGQGAEQFVHEDFPGLGPRLAALFADIRAGLPVPEAGMQGFYQWLKSEPSTPFLGGGRDGIAGFNHPGREVGRFANFEYDSALQERIISLEMFNRGEDYLFEGTTSGRWSPLNQCLNAGWWVGLLGVSDEHGREWGFPDGKGRGGLWVTDLTRSGVRAAMTQRRFFATRLRGLRLDVGAEQLRKVRGSGRLRPAGAMVRMGSRLSRRRGIVRFSLDIDRGSAWAGGKPLSVQVLRPSSGPLPEIAEAYDFVAGPHRKVFRFQLPVDPDDGKWVVLRITDPEDEPDSRAAGTPYAAFGGAIAYASPLYFLRR